MEWKDVGAWLKDNGTSGAALVGSLLTGNIPGAVAAGVSLVSSATGHGTPDKALETLQADPATMVRLRELAMQDEANIREHVRAMEELRLKDLQAEHEETGKTIRAGDAAEDPFVRRTRPGQSWLSLVAAIVYVFLCFAYDKTPDNTVLGLLLALPWAYAGLRQLGKGVDSIAAAKAAK